VWWICFILCGIFIAAGVTPATVM